MVSSIAGGSESSHLGTVAELIAFRAARQPDAPALRALSGQEIGYGALAGQMETARVSLRRLGVGPRDRVAVLMSGGPVAVACTLTVMSAAVLAPIDPLTPLPGIVDLLHRLDPAALAALPGPEMGLALDAARQAGLPVIQVVPDPANPFLLSFDGVAPTAPAPDSPVSSADLAMIISTSGTTGKPKLVASPHGSHGGPMPPGVDPLGLGPGERSIIMTPLAHGHGHASINRPLRAGALVIVPERPDVAQLPAWMAAHDPTWLDLTPHLLARLADLLDRGALTPNPALRFVRCGSAHLDPALRERAEGVLRVPIYNAYGSSEGGNIAMEGTVWPSRPGTVGRITCPVRITLDGIVVAPGEAGEIEVSGPRVFAGYLDDPEATARAFTPDRWYRTGDRGYVRDGYLALLGRIDEVINSGGLKIDPAEIDAALLAYPGVRDAAAYPAPHPVKGQVAAAAVVLEPGRPLDRRALRRWLLDRIGVRKVPVVIREVESLPRTASGKVERWRLAEMHEAGSDATSR